MPDPDLAMILGFVTAIVLVVMIGTVVSKAIERRGPRPSKELSEMSARLERIEAAVDSIAIEVERVSEGQRFASRLLAERQPERQPDRLAR